MENLVSRVIIHNWQRKFLALISAIVIWFFVNHSIIETKVIPSVPIRVINLPTDKTVLGLLPNGVLSKRITLTLTGTKDVINELEPGDLVVVIDASTIDRDEWVLQINKKNLVSLNPSIDLVHHVTNVQHPEYILKLAKLVTAKIPVTILTPTGESPSGYQYIDVWPRHLFQTVSGPEEAVQNLKMKGLEVVFDLQEITQKDLDSIKSTHANYQDDEISFLVPHQWKQVAIPFHNDAKEEINDPEAQYLRIDFLRKEYQPIGKEIPIQVFYPLKTLATLNPSTLAVEISDLIHERNQITTLNMPLYLYGVSRLFVDIIKENILITLIAAPKKERDILQWSAQVVDPRSLEDTYVAFLISNTSVGKSSQLNIPKSREVMLRKRFREYMQKLTLYTAPDQKLNLESRIEDNKIHVNIEK